MEKLGFRGFSDSPQQRLGIGYLTGNRLDLRLLCPDLLWGGEARIRRGGARRKRVRTPRRVIFFLLVLPYSRGNRKTF